MWHSDYSSKLSSSRAFRRLLERRTGNLHGRLNAVAVDVHFGRLFIARHANMGRFAGTEPLHAHVDPVGLQARICMVHGTSAHRLL